MTKQTAQQLAKLVPVAPSPEGQAFLEDLQAKMEDPFWQTFSEIRQLASRISGAMDDLECTLEDEGRLWAHPEFEDIKDLVQGHADRVWTEANKLCELKYPR